MELLLEFSCPSGACPNRIAADVRCFLKKIRWGLKPV